MTNTPKTDAIKQHAEENGIPVLPGTNEGAAKTAALAIRSMRFDSIIRIASEALDSNAGLWRSTGQVRSVCCSLLIKGIVESTLSQETGHDLSSALMDALNPKRLRRALRRLVAQGLAERTVEDGSTLWRSVATEQGDDA